MAVTSLSWPAGRPWHRPEPRPGSAPSWTNRAVLPAGTRPSSSWTLTHSSGIKGSRRGLGQVRAPARSGDPEHPVFVDPDDGTNRGALAPLQPGEGAVEV